MAKHLIMILVEDVSDSVLKFSKEDLEQEARYISELRRPGISPAGAKNIRKAVQKVVEIEPGVDWDEIIGDYFADLEAEMEAK
jgi:hypothetical protein